MSKAISDSRYVERLQKTIATVTANQSPSLEGVAADNEHLHSVEEWLSSLLLLNGVPFNHLLANPNLLPQDSIRFFYVDQNWLAALVDGALSIGLSSSGAASLMAALKPGIVNEARARTPMIRRRPQHLADETAPSVSNIWTGFLLRSPVVYAYPGLEVTAFAGKQPISGTDDGNGVPDYQGTDQLDMLRMDRLAPDVMLCLFSGIAALVQINEPPEGLAFGTQEGQFQLRGLGEEWSDGKVYWQAGEEIVNKQGNVYFPVVWRDSGKRTVDLCSLNASLPATLASYQAHQVSNPFGPADLALQLISLPEQKKFYRLSPVEPKDE
jgi:hypothetical protein